MQIYTTSTTTRNNIRNIAPWHSPENSSYANRYITEPIRVEFIPREEAPQININEQQLLDFLEEK